MFKNKLSLGKSILVFISLLILFTLLEVSILFSFPEVEVSTRIIIWKWLGLMVYIFLFFIVVTYLSKIEKINFFKEIKESQFSINLFLFVILIGVSWKVIQTPLLDFWQLIGGHLTIPYLYEPNSFEETLTGKIDTSIDSNFIIRIIPRIIISIIIIPIFEELVFRRYFFLGMKNKYNLSFAIIVSSLLFSLYHFPILAQMFHTLFGGLIAAILFYRSQQIWAPILLHSIYNISAIWIISDVIDIYDEMMDGIQFTFLYFTITIISLSIIIFLLAKVKPLKNNIENVTL